MFRIGNKTVQASAQNGGARLEFGRYAAFVLVISSIALIWIGVWSKTQSDRALAVASARSSAFIVARSLEEQLLRMIRAVDQTLLFVRDAYVRAPDEFNMADWQKGGRYLPDTAFQVSMIDKDGFLLTSNMGARSSLSLKDRDHFKIHLERAGDELFISKPVFGRLSQKWSIQFTRRVVLKDGTFAGVVVASVDPQEISNFYSSVVLGPHGTVTLVGEDGAIRARAPYDPSIFSLDLRNTPGANLRSGQPESSQIGTSTVDGFVRLFVSRGISGYPLRLMVGQTLDDIYTAAEADPSFEIKVGVVATLWILAFLIAIMAYQRNLARARDAAEAGTRARTTFLATMSHEIRTPLNGVIGIADLLSASDLGSEQQRMVATLKQSASHLLVLLNDLLDFSKLDANQLQLERIPFSIQDVINGTADLLRPAAQEKGLRLYIDIPDSTPALIKGDPGRIRQILLNLVGNAIKFTDTGSVRVTVAGEPVRDGQYRLQIFVADTGCGIAPEKQVNLFNPFSQSDGSIYRRYGGTGLGLAICKRLVQHMGGEISVTSDAGKGSTFGFSLVVDAVDELQPRVEEVPAPAATEARDPAPTNAGVEPLPAFKILVAEDNRTNQFVIAQMLRLLGQRVEVVADGAQAVEAMRRDRYDLVLMDMMMPVMDGLEATTLIRAMPGPSGRTPIYALTANSFDSDEAACRAAGMNSFMTKPVTRRQIEGALRQLMQDVAQEQTAAGEEKPEEPKPAIREPAGMMFDIAAYRDLVDDLGEEMARNILVTFLDETDDYLVQLTECLASENRVQLKRLAHSLKGSAQTIGFSTVSHLAREVEETSLNAPLEAIGATVRRLGDEYGQLREKIDLRATGT